MALPMIYLSTPHVEGGFISILNEATEDYPQEQTGQEWNCKIESSGV
jgi:hypothetical protein